MKYHEKWKNNWININNIQHKFLQKKMLLEIILEISTLRIFQHFWNMYKASVILIIILFLKNTDYFIYFKILYTINNK